LNIFRKSQYTVNFSTIIKIALTLSFNLIPILYIFTTSNFSLIIITTLFWFIGAIITFYPFIIWVYPHLMSKTGVYLLNLILIIFSSWLSMTFVTLFLKANYNLLNFSLNDIILLSSLYIICVNAIIANFILIPNIDFYKEESLF
jgi:hypothetical protein